jgi:hypothetical protein
MNKNMKSKIAIIFLLVTILLPFRSIAQTTSQAFIVQGGVSSKTDGEALIGVSVSELDDNNRVVSATVTDFNGHYVLKVKNPANRIAISYIGYVKQIRKIDGKKVIDVVLVENTQTIKQVEITATKKNGTGRLCYSST